MPKADVTYNTIGFIGSVGTNATFKLYLDDEKTGAKSYHVWFKQLGGTGKLTLTTGKSGATDLVLGVGTYVAIISVDENGNIVNVAETPTDLIQSGNTQPATSNGVAGAISTEATARDDAINAEANARDDAITSAINDLSVREQGGDERYIKSIKQVDGKISVEIDWVDTDIDVVSVGGVPLLSHQAIINALNTGKSWNLNAQTAKKLNTIFNVWTSNTAYYYKISGMLKAGMEAVFLLQSRAGELIVISCGHGDGSSLAIPKIKRLLNTYSKIAGFSYSGDSVYMRVFAYSHECILTQIAGSEITNISITSATQAQYDSGTQITIET
jgi:hypothetical protein